MLFSKQKVHCNTCGVGFETNFNKHDGRFCSDKCWKEGQWRRTLSVLGKPYSPKEKEVKTININGSDVQTDAYVLSYADIAEMCMGKDGVKYCPTVVYSRGPVSKPEGMLWGNREIEVVDGMRISCDVTGNA